MKVEYGRFMVLLGTSGLLLTQPIAAQTPLPRVRGGVGGNLVVAVPTGELADQIDAGFGAAFNGQYNLSPNGALRLRLDFGFLQYGSESREVCLSSTIGCRIVVDLITENSILYGGIGPELALPYGAVRPYINGGIGLSHFETASRLEDLDDEDSSFRTRHLGDSEFAVSGGGGLYIPVSFGRTPVAIDLSARYHRNGTVSYLREGDIHDNPNGTISFTPTRTRADFVTLQLGVAVGLRPGQRP